MKKPILAAVAVASLGVGTAFAQGYPVPYYPETDRPLSGPRVPTSFLGKDTDIGKLFHPSNGNQPVVDKAAATSTKSC